MSCRPRVSSPGRPHLTAGSTCWAERCDFGRNSRAEVSPALLPSPGTCCLPGLFGSLSTTPVFKAGGLGTEKPRDTGDQTWRAVWRVTGVAPTAPPEALCGHAGRQKRERTHTCGVLFEKYLVHLAAPGPGCTTQDLWSVLWHTGSRSRTRDGTSPLHSEHGVLATRPQGSHTCSEPRAFRPADASVQRTGH